MTLRGYDRAPGARAIEQDRIDEYSRGIQAGAGARMLPSSGTLTLTAGVENWIEHGLAATVTGWRVVDISAPAMIWRVTGTTAPAGKFLALGTTATASVKIEVW